MKVRSIFALCFILIASVALANKETGNGGVGVRCPNGLNVKPLEILDYYQARTDWNIKIDLGSNSLSAAQKVQLALKRLTLHNPNRRNLYIQWASTFNSEAHFVSGQTLGTISDMGAVAIPNGCHFEQVIVQQEPILPGDHRYLVNKDLWDILDSDDQAGFILHEIILRDLTHQDIPIEDSRVARYFNALISSHSLDLFSLKKYLELLQTLKFNSGDAQLGIPIRVFGCPKNLTPGKKCESPTGLLSFWDDNTLKNAYSSPTNKAGDIYKSSYSFFGNFFPFEFHEADTDEAYIMDFSNLGLITSYAPRQNSNLPISMKSLSLKLGLLTVLIKDSPPGFIGFGSSRSEIHFGPFYGGGPTIDGPAHHYPCTIGVTSKPPGPNYISIDAATRTVQCNFSETYQF